MRGNRINISKLRTAYNKKFRVYTTDFDMKFRIEAFEKNNSNNLIVKDKNIF